MFVHPVSLIPDTRARSYSVSYLGNVVGGDIVRYINLPIAELKVGWTRLNSTSLTDIFGSQPLKSVRSLFYSKSDWGYCM